MAVSVCVWKDGSALAEWCVSGDDPVDVAIRGLEECEGAEVAVVAEGSRAIRLVYGSRMNGERDAPMYGRERDEERHLKRDGRGDVVVNLKMVFYEKLRKVLGYVKKSACDRQGGG